MTMVVIVGERKRGSIMLHISIVISMVGGGCVVSVGER